MLEKKISLSRNIFLQKKKEKKDSKKELSIFKFS